MHLGEKQKPAVTRVKDDLSEGIRIRENGDYVNGGTLLLAAYSNSKVLENEDLIVESGNQLSIQYRLQAGRYARENDIAHARDYSLKALNLYTELEEMSLIDPEHHSTQRNFSHALLYSGFIDQAVVELEKSVEVQPNAALRGDELCHLASSFIDEEHLDLARAEELVEEGISLLEVNDGSPIALTYGFMTKASILAKQNRLDEAKVQLEKASEIAKDKNLGVRQEEIRYLQKQTPENLNILNVVSGRLREERRHKTYGK